MLNYYSLTKGLRKNLLLGWVVLSSLLLISQHHAQAQCIATAPFGSGTLTSATNTPVSFSTCLWGGEYATVTIADLGDYSFSSSLATDYITITDVTNLVIAHGVTPVSVTNLATGTVRVHIHGDATCSTPTGCRAVSGAFVGTVPPPTAYCTTGGPTSLVDSELRNVTLQGALGTSINNPTSCPAVTGIRDFTAQTVKLQRGETYTMDLEIGTCGGNFGNVVQAWIDYDNDFIYDITESLGTNNASATNTVSITFTVPATANLGNTRMRVIQRETGVGSLPLDPCANFSWGSTHEYTVEVIDPNAGLTIQIGNGTNVQNNSLYFPVYRFSAASGNRYNRSLAIYEEATLINEGFVLGSTINSIAFNKALGAPNATNNLSLKVWMRNGTRTAPLAAESWTALTPGAALVYDNPSLVFADTDDWVELVLDTGFVYLGGTLEILTENEMDGVSPYSTNAFQWISDPSFGTGNVIGTVSTVATFSSANLSVSTLYSNLPNTRFNITPPSGTDFALFSMVSPIAGGTCASGSAPVEIAVANFSTTAITSATINWSVNGVAQTPFSYTGNLALGVFDTVTVGTASLTLGTSYTFDFAISDVNGAGLDDNQANDTLAGTFDFGLNGAFTINANQPTGGTNFNSFNDFSAALANGICGPIVVDVVAGSGPYDEQVVFAQIIGADSVNTITINGNGNTLRFEATNTNERITLQLNGADYMTFDNLRIEANGSGSGFVVHMTNGADHNTISNCEIITSTSSTSTVFGGIIMSGSPTSATVAGNSGNFNTFENNYIEGGYYAIAMNGNSSTDRAVGNKIANNVLIDYHFYGVYNRAQENAEIVDNDLSRINRTALTTFYGVYFINDCPGTYIARNFVHDNATSGTSTSAAYPFYATGASGTASAPIRFENNVIYNINSNGTHYGFYFLGSTNFVEIYHNTINLDNPTQTGAGVIAGFYHTGAATDIDIKNNIISMDNGSTGAKRAIWFSNAAAAFTSNNNAFHLPSGNSVVGRYGTTDYATLTDWQGLASTPDLNSVVGNPVFADALNGNLTPLSATVNNIGAPIGVLEDILGNPRSTTTPDPGAYEFTPVTSDLNFLSASLHRGICLSNTDTARFQIENVLGGTVDFSTDPVTLTWNVTGPVNSNGTVTINAGTLAALDTLILDLPTIDMSVEGTYELNAFIGSSTHNAFAGNDTALAFSLFAFAPAFDIQPDSVLITSYSDVASFTINTPYFSAGGSLDLGNFSNNGSGGNFFDIEVTNTDGILLDGFDVVNTLSSANYEVYYRPGTYVGFTGASTGWISLGQYTVVGQGNDAYTPIELNSSVLLPQGIYGIRVVSTNGGHRYVNGNTLGAPLQSNADLTIFEGQGTANDPFPASLFTVRNFTGKINYSLTSTVVPGLEWRLDGVLIDSTALVEVGPFSSNGIYQVTASYPSICGLATDTAYITVDLPFCPPNAVCGSNTDTISSDLFATAANWLSGCPANIEVVVPPGNEIIGVDVEYTAIARGGAWISEQRSFVRVPAINAREAATANGVGNSAGAFSYNRQGLTLANGLTDTVNFELHLGRTWPASTPAGCNTIYQFIPDSAIKFIVYYDLLPACPAPLAFALDGVTETTASFTFNSSAAAFEIEYGPVGFTPGNGTIATATGSPATVSGLTANTSYDFYLRAICGTDTSAFVGPVTAATACGVFTAPFVEDFEANSPTTACWTQDQISALPRPWTFAAGSSGGLITAAFSGALNARHTSTGSGPHVTHLITPVIDLSGSPMNEVSFAYAQEEWFSDQNFLNVYYRDSASAPWQLVFSDSTEKTVWTLASAMLPNNSATAQIGFEGVDNWGRAVVLDDVYIGPPPAALNPFALLSPPDNALLLVAGPANNPIVVEWESAGAGANYDWLADLPTGNFTTPLVTLPSDNNGADTTLTLTVGAVDALLASLGVNIGDTATISWTVRATSGADTVMATQPFTLSLVRLGVAAPLFVAAPQNSNSTSGIRNFNGTATHSFFRNAYMIFANEYTNANINSGDNFSAVGFTLSAPTSGTVTAHLKLYLQNTTDASYLKGNVWTGIEPGMTLVYDDTVTIPMGVTSYTVPLSTSITYGGNNMYLATDWELIGTPLTTSMVYFCEATIPGNLVNANSPTAPPATLNQSSAFRPEVLWGVDRKADDLDVVTIFAKGKNASGFGYPEDIQVVVTNNGYLPADKTLTLSIAGANTFTATQPVQLASAATATYTFTGFSGANIGFNAITASVPADDVTVNDSKTWHQQTTADRLSYADTVITGLGGVGYNTGSGLLLTRHQVNSQRAIEEVIFRISDNAASAGNDIYAVVVDSTGAIVAQTPPATLTTADLQTFKSFVFATPYNVGANEVFYVGLAQTPNATTGYFPMAFQAENPTRDSAYFTAPLAGGTLPATVPGFRLMIEAVLGNPVFTCDDPTALAVAPDCDEAVVTWTSSSGVVGTNIEFGTQGFTQGAGTFVGSQTSPYTIIGLTPGTAYDIYIQDTCANSGTSNWVGPVTFTTDDLPTAAFTQTLVSTTLTGASYDFDASASTGATTYAWLFGDGGVGTGVSPSHIYANNGTYTVTLIVTNNCGSDTATAQIVVQGISVENLSLHALQLYPNPTVGEVTLSGILQQAGKHYISVVDGAGKIIYQTTANGNEQRFTMDFSQLASGAYQVRIANDFGVTHKPLIIRR
ncbi:MAG: GEVED domain-containing protein [Schleiferiaceae bacterium]|nr:GEVED domain-containing protein [Schleiferiaceae bacterium]